MQEEKRARLAPSFVPVASFIFTACVCTGCAVPGKGRSADIPERPWLHSMRFTRDLQLKAPECATSYRWKIHT